jgi:DNA-directed RNA polymerase subunit RPC12/RpoP
MEECSNCSKPFKVTEYKLAMPGTKEREPIICPYCNQTIDERISNGWWITSKLSDKEIDEYLNMKKENKG